MSPSSRRHAASRRSAVRMIQAPSSTISPFCSATGMNAAGLTRPALRVLPAHQGLDRVAPARRAARRSAGRRPGTGPASSAARSSAPSRAASAAPSSSAGDQRTGSPARLAAYIATSAWRQQLHRVDAGAAGHARCSRRSAARGRRRRPAGAARPAAPRPVARPRRRSRRRAGPRTRRRRSGPPAPRRGGRRRAGRPARAEHPVAGGAAELVVDVLEAVQADQGQLRHGPWRGPRARVCSSRRRLARPVTSSARVIRASSAACRRAWSCEPRQPRDDQQRTARSSRSPRPAGLTGSSPTHGTKSSAGASSEQAPAMPSRVCRRPAPGTATRPPVRPSRDAARRRPR